MKTEDNGHGHKAVSVMLAFLVGGVVGAGIALLLAPESGRKMRKRISHVAEDTRGKAEGSLGEVKDKGTTAYETGSSSSRIELISPGSDGSGIEPWA